MGIGEIEGSVMLNALWCAFRLCVVASEEEIWSVKYPIYFHVSIICLASYSHYEGGEVAQFEGERRVQGDLPMREEDHSHSTSSSQTTSKATNPIPKSRI
jgi:hypothetical protein